MSEDRTQVLRMEWEGLSEMAWKRKVEEMCGWTLRTSENACGNLFLRQLPKVYIYVHMKLNGAVF